MVDFQDRLTICYELKNDSGSSDFGCLRGANFGYKTDLVKYVPILSNKDVSNFSGNG